MSKRKVRQQRADVFEAKRRDPEDTDGEGDTPDADDEVLPSWFDYMQQGEES